MIDYYEALETTYKTLVIDLHELAHVVESTLESYIEALSYPEGIYCKSKIEPILRADTVYRMLHNGEFITYRTGDVITGPIYEINKGNRKLLVSSHMVNNQKTMLNDRPIIPYHGVRIVHTELNNYINSMVNYKRTGSISNSDNIKYRNFISHLDNEVILDIDDKIRDLLCETKGLLIDLLKDYGDHVINCTLSDSKMTVGISIDRRALQWLMLESDRQRAKEAHENI